MNFASVQFSYSFIYLFIQQIFTYCLPCVRICLSPGDMLIRNWVLYILCPVRMFYVLNETVFIKYFFTSSFQFSFLAASHPNEWLPPREHQQKLKTFHLSPEQPLQILFLSGPNQSLTISKSQWQSILRPVFIVTCLCHQHTEKTNYLVCHCWEADGTEMSRADHCQWKESTFLMRDRLLMKWFKGFSLKKKKDQWLLTSASKVLFGYWKSQNLCWEEKPRWVNPEKKITQ